MDQAGSHRHCSSHSSVASQIAADSDLVESTKSESESFASESRVLTKGLESKSLKYGFESVESESTDFQFKSLYSTSVAKNLALAV